MGMEGPTGSASGGLSGCACTNLGCASPALWLVVIEGQLLTGCRPKACRLRVGRFRRSPGTTRRLDRIRTFDSLHRFFSAPLFLHLVYKNYSMMRSLRASIATMTLIDR